MFVCQGLIYTNKIATSPSPTTTPSSQSFRVPLFQSLPKLSTMINGAHVVIHTKDADADRNFFYEPKHPVPPQRPITKD